MADKLRSILFPHFFGGLGHKNHDPKAGGYAITTNAITRFGSLMNGLKEVAEPTGMPAGYRPIKQIKHNDVNIRIAWNGTNSKILRIEGGVWVEKETVNTARCRDVISFHDGTNSILAWCFGADAAFRYSTNDGTTWTASTFAGTADNVKFFLNQQNNLSGPRVLLAVDPNELYFASSLVNGSTVTTSTKIGDGSAQNYWTSLTQDDLGVVYCGQRYNLWAYANGPSVLVAGPYNDPPADAGGQSDRFNFENPQVMSNGVIIYQVEGYDLIGVRHSQLHVELAPRWTPRLNGWVLPRLELPINCVQVVGDYLIVAVGSGSTASNRGVVSSPGGTNLLQNTFSTKSEIYVAQIVGDALVWHGSELTCTNMLRGMAYDEDDGYLYLFSGESESADLQATRCFFFLSAPEVSLSSSNLQMNVTDAAILETAQIGGENPFDMDRPLWLKVTATGLASTVPSLRVDHRFVGEHDSSSAYLVWETYTNGQRALTGTAAPPYLASTVGRLQLRLTADSTSTPDRFGIVRSMELVVGSFASERLPVGAL